MQVIKYVEREDGGADLELDLSPEETRLMIEYALRGLIMDAVRAAEAEEITEGTQ